MLHAASKMKEADRLFDYAMIVGLAVDEDCNHCVVHVLFHHPEQARIIVICAILEDVCEIICKIQFCFLAKPKFNFEFDQLNFKNAICMMWN